MEHNEEDSAPSTDIEINYSSSRTDKSHDGLRIVLKMIDSC